MAKFVTRKMQAYGYMTLVEVNGEWKEGEVYWSSSKKLSNREIKAIIKDGEAKKIAKVVPCDTPKFVQEKEYKVPVEDFIRIANEYEDKINQEVK